MGREQLVALIRVAVAGGNELRGDEASRRRMHEEQTQAADGNAGCRTAIANSDFIGATGNWPRIPARAGISSTPAVALPRLWCPVKVRSTAREFLPLRAFHPSRSRARS